MKTSKRSTEKRGDTTIYKVPLFTCSCLENELKKDKLNIDEIKLLVYNTMRAEFDVSTIQKASLNCFPDNKPIENKENKIMFCETCVEDKELFLKVVTRQDSKDDKKKTISAVFRLGSGSQGLKFNKVE